MIAAIIIALFLALPWTTLPPCMYVTTLDEDQHGAITAYVPLTEALALVVKACP